MNLIKVNFNNLAVKKPRQLVPYFYCYKYEDLNEDNTISKTLRIEVNDRLTEEPYYVGYAFEIYINNVLVSYITNNTNSYVEIRNFDAFSLESFNVKIKGYYIDESQIKHSFETNYIEIYNYVVAKENQVCSERVLCTDYLYGYMYEGNFYTTIIQDGNNTTYNGIVDPITFDGRYIDLNTKIVYKWDRTNQEFKVL